MNRTAKSKKAASTNLKVEPDDMTTNEHKAIESMMLMFKSVDYVHSNEFIDIETALMCSPAFREFSKESGVNRHDAARLLIAGQMYQRLVKRS